MTETTDTSAARTGSRARWMGRLLLGALLLGVFVLGYRFLGRSGTAVSRAADAGATEGFIVDGTLETDEVDVASKLPGRLARVLVDEGDRVTAGQLLAVVQAEELDAKHDQGVAGLRAAETQVAQGGLAATLEDRKSGDQVHQAQAGIDAAMATLGMARAKLTALQEGVRPQELANAAAAVQGAEAGLGMAQAKLEALQEGARPQEIEQARQAVAAAQAVFDTAKKTNQRVKGLADEGLIDRF